MTIFSDVIILIEQGSIKEAEDRLTGMMLPPMTEGLSDKEMDLLVKQAKAEAQVQIKAYQANIKKALNDTSTMEYKVNKRMIMTNCSEADAEKHVKEIMKRRARKEEERRLRREVYHAGKGHTA